MIVSRRQCSISSMGPMPGQWICCKQTKLCIVVQYMSLLLPAQLLLLLPAPLPGMFGKGWFSLIVHYC